MTIRRCKRTEWLSALSTLPADRVLAITKEVSKDWKIRPKSIPQCGLGLLKLNDSAFNEPFYLGEIPIASAWLEITTAQGYKAEGAAQVMDDRMELAEAFALCDAILAVQLPGWEEIAALVEEGLQQREAITIERKRLLAHSQVEFTLLDEVGNNHVES